MKSALLFAIAAALALLVGCGSTSRLYVKSTQATNEGNTFYMMVREVEGKTTIAERYQEMAAHLFADPADPSVIAKVPIFPGNTANLTFDNPDKDIIVYFFFTNPGSNWRLPLHKPLPSEVFVELGTHQIEHVQVKRH